MRVPSYKVLLWSLLGVGFVVRVALAFGFYGVTYDIDSLRIVGHALAGAHPFDVYDSGRWPYPAGFMPWISLSRGIADISPLPFHGVVQVPMILADLAIAWVVQLWLGRLGRPPAERLFAAALVALGPSFILISGYHGQLDPLATLPPLLGAYVWSVGGERRALKAGALVGLGACMKVVPLFMLLALLPTARSRREIVTLVAIAAAIPLATVLPFLIANLDGTWHALHSNHGVPGFGSYGLLAQPDLIDRPLYGDQVQLSGLSTWLYDSQNVIVAAAALLVGAFAYLRRLDPIDAAASIWLAVFVANPEWGYEYLIWGLPYFILARRYIEVLALQLVLIVPEVVLYRTFATHKLGQFYVPTLTLVWAAMAVTLVVWLLRLRRGATLGPDQWRWATLRWAP
jgi:hypothetical protein